MKLPIAKIKWLAALMFALLSALGAWAQDDGVPPRPNPPRLVNDYAGILPDAQVMEDSLEAFARHTSNHIVVVTLPSLNGMEPADMAQRIGQKWGVGKKDLNNGLVILIQPKTQQQRGQVFIATGYGLEGALPDAACKSIVDNQMIPRFMEGNYSAGVWQALHLIMPVAAGEYSFEDAPQNQMSVEAIIAMIVGLLIIGYIIYIFVKRTSVGDDGLSVAEAFIIGHLLSGSGGGSDSGSSDSGWGGFDGGSFGGGGAGGSW